MYRDPIIFYKQSHIISSQGLHHGNIVFLGAKLNTALDHIHLFLMGLMQYHPIAHHKILISTWCHVEHYVDFSSI